MLPFEQFIKENELTTFGKIKLFIERNNLNFGIKEDENVALIYFKPITDRIEEIETLTKNCIIDKETNQILCTQYNNVIYNENALNCINSIPINKLKVYESYDGTTLLVFNHKDKWYVTTSRCLDADMSRWHNTRSHKELFIDTIGSEEKLNELDKNNCYTFILVHSENANIQYIEKETKKLYLVRVTEKITLKQVSVDCPWPCVQKQKEHNITNIQDICDILAKLNNENEEKQTILHDGLIVCVEQDHPITCRLMVPTFIQYVTFNMNERILTKILLYHAHYDHLEEYLKYKTGLISENTEEIKKRWKQIYETLVSEIHYLYHTTRKYNNKVYQHLTPTIKNMLKQIHENYVKNKQSITRNNITDFIKAELPQNIYSYLQERKTIKHNFTQHNKILVI